MSKEVIADTEDIVNHEDQKLETQDSPGEFKHNNGAPFLQDDDEFKDFVADDWDGSHDDLTLEKTVWIDTWEDDDDEEDFYDQLKKEREQRNNLMKVD